MKTVNLFLALIVIPLITFTTLSGKAQNAGNYYLVVDSLETYYNAHPELKQDDDGDYSQFIRWKEFWRDRVYGGDASKKGSFQLFREAVKNYTDNINYYNRSTLIGSDWHCLGPENITVAKRGLVSSIYVDTAADPNMNTIFIGTDASGIWKTTDGGLNWHNITDPSKITLLGIRDITGDPYNGNIIYAATGFKVMDFLHIGGIGIIRSMDGGVTWEKLLTFNPEDDKVVYRLLVDPYNSQRIYALVDNQILRNTSGGLGYWETIFTCPNVPGQYGERRNLRDIQMKPGDPGTLYVASEDRKEDASSNNQAKVYKIKNANSTNINNIDSVCLDAMFIPSDQTLLRQRFQIAVTPADSSALYVGCQQIIDAYHFRFKLWKYDNVNHWKLKMDYDESFGYLQKVSWDKIEILVSPSDTGVVYVAGILWNKFIHWNYVQNNGPSNPNIHGDIRYSKIYQIAPADSGKNDIVFCGHDGGISKSIDGVKNWQNLNGTGMVITEFYGIGGANKIPDKIYCGSQDNSFFRDSLGVWLLSGEGDNGNPAVDQVCPDTLFIPAWINNGVYKSIDGGHTFGVPPYYMDTVFYNLEHHLPNSPIVINPQNHKSVFIGYHNLWKSNKYGDPNSFKKIPITVANSNSYNDGDCIRTFCIAPKDTATIYVAYDAPIVHYTGYQQVKLVRSIDNGVTWKDLTSTLGTLLDYYGITSMEVCPTNKNKLWISFGGYWAPNDRHRVMVSSDTGNTWKDYSAGLPNTPVNCIKYMNGTDERLFVGTDVGVFYRDTFDSVWQPFNTGLPICIVTDLEINDKVNKIRAGTYGRGLYETDLTCVYDTSAWVIHYPNANILNDTAIDRSIIIDSSFTLTVKARLKLPPSARIIVKAGAKLIVDGGVLTNRCYNMWQGIRVLGHPNLHQNTFNQGYVLFKNRAVLENARIGVSTNSGLIFAENSIFRNNCNAVKFESYKYDQISWFKKDTFETTRNFLDTNYSVPQDFVSLSEVKGVRFQGCLFQNTTVQTDSVPRSLKGRGIYSTNASYSIDQFEDCPVQVEPCPNPQDTPSKFKGLYYGIRVFNADPTKSIQVRNSIFDHNYRGIYLGASNNSTITKNRFLIPHHTQPGNDTCYGLYLGTCTGYIIEDNVFSSPGNALLQQGNSLNLREIGLIVDNSGGSPNEIYRNRFETLDIAINAQRLNRQDAALPDIPGGGEPYPYVPTGLVLKCNTYNNNSFDEMATRYLPNGLEGIAKNQGAKTLYGKDQAGNTFSPYHAQAHVPESDLRNTADNFIYYHQLPTTGFRVKPEYYTPEPKVVPKLVFNNFDTTICCPPHSSNNTTQTDLKLAISREDAVSDSLLALYKDLVDGGSTDEVNNTLTFSTPPDALDIRQDLLGGSPYLSDTVMKSAIEKENVLPNEMIRDILVANPQSAKNENVMNSLNDRFVPMPDSMMAEILDGKYQLSPKEELEAQIALHILYFKNRFNNLVQLYKSDSMLSQTSDSLILFLSSVKDLDGKYMLAFEYLSQGDTINMDNTLGSISGIFKLDKSQQRQYQDYLTYFSFLKSLRAQHKNIFQIDNSQFVQLQQLYSTANEPVSSYVRNILIVNNIFNYYEPIIIPSETKSAPEQEILKTGQFGNGCYLKVFPNPAKNYFIVEYNTINRNISTNEIKLTISSTIGGILETRIMYKQQDQVLFQTGNYKPGSYICSLLLGNKTMVSRKFTIIQ